MSQVTVNIKVKVPHERMKQLYEVPEVKRCWEKMVGKSNFKKFFSSTEQNSIKGVILSGALKKVLLNGMDLKEALVAELEDFNKGF